MKFDRKEPSILFMDTNISDIFITKYLPDAPSDAIKVYLYIMFQTKFADDISIKSISNAVNLSYNVVKSAFDYWEEKGILVKQTKGYIIRNIKEIELFEKYNPKINLTNKEIMKKNKENEKADVIDNINKMFFQGVMSPTWVPTIYSWFDRFSFSDEVMFALFQYAKDKNVLNKNYIEQVALTWSNQEIKEYEDLNKYISQKQYIYTEGKRIAKKLRLYRNVTEFEEEYIKKWLLDYKLDNKKIDLALKLAAENGVLSFKYLDVILSDWYNKNLKTTEEIKKYIKENRENKINIDKTISNFKKENKVFKKQINFKNPHEQREFANIDEFYD